MTILSIIDWPSVTGSIALLNIAVSAVTIVWILALKREPTSAIAWCLIVIFLPVLGVTLFILFGYQSVHLPLKRKRQHAFHFRTAGHRGAATQPTIAAGYEGLASLASQLGASPQVGGNAVTVYHDGATAYEAMFDAIRQAKHHVHMQFFIARGDESGARFMTALGERAQAGAEVRFLYDAVGSWRLHTRVLRILEKSGGRSHPYLTLLNPLRRRVQINLRNHRKLLVIDGRVGFTGGLNLGDEYLGRAPFFGPWRDTFVRVEGPAVADLQRVFAEDWDFAADEELIAPGYYPDVAPAGTAAVQVAWSGPDQDIKVIREVYFAAIMRAQKRVWLATPYFVPDVGLFDAICLAARLGRDVRVLCPFRPDKWLPHLAGRYLWGELLRAGVKVYQYTNGFMHAKVLMIDDTWSSIGSPNFDNRSLYLNFEATCLIESPEVQAELERGFLRDLKHSIRLNPSTYAGRPFVAKMAENACRLLSPVL